MSADGAGRRVPPRRRFGEAPLHRRRFERPGRIERGQWSCAHGSRAPVFGSIILSQTTNSPGRGQSRVRDVNGCGNRSGLRPAGEDGARFLKVPQGTGWRGRDRGQGPWGGRWRRRGRARSEGGGPGRAWRSAAGHGSRILIHDGVNLRCGQACLSRMIPRRGPDREPDGRFRERPGGRRCGPPAGLRGGLAMRSIVLDGLVGSITKRAESREPRAESCEPRAESREPRA